MMKMIEAVIKPSKLEAVKEALAEDAEDLGAFAEREGEPLISYDEMLKRLREDGRI